MRAIRRRRAEWPRRSCRPPRSCLQRGEPGGVAGPGHFGGRLRAGAVASSQGRPGRSTSPQTSRSMPAAEPRGPVCPAAPSRRPAAGQPASGPASRVAVGAGAGASSVPAMSAPGAAPASPGSSHGQLRDRRCTRVAAGERRGQHPPITAAGPRPRVPGRRDRPRRELSPSPPRLGAELPAAGQPPWRAGRWRSLAALPEQDVAASRAGIPGPDRADRRGCSSGLAAWCASTLGDHVARQRGRGTCCVVDRCDVAQNPLHVGYLELSRHPGL